MEHQKLAGMIAQELLEDESALAVMLYGSVSRHEENTNSDIDLLVIVNKKHCQKKHEIRNGIPVEYLEMHTEYLQEFIHKDEIPVLFTLTEGIVLFDKGSILPPFITQAKKRIEKGPPVNTKWENERYATKKRSDITEIYSDILDTDDEVVFHYLVSLLVSAIIPIINENYSLWPKTRKKTIPHLKSQCYDGYKYMEILLEAKFSLPEKRNAARDLVEFALKKQGGLLEGNALIFEF